MAYESPPFPSAMRRLGLHERMIGHACRVFKCHFAKTGFASTINLAGSFHVDFEDPIKISLREESPLDFAEVNR